MINIYRISNNSFSYKTKLPSATKEECFHNFIWNVLGDDDRVIVINDDGPEFLEDIKDNRIDIIEPKQGGNASTFKEAIEISIMKEDEEIVYLLEDDYFHKKNSRNLILEGLELFDYVSLYDHPDKYDYVESSALKLGKTRHWRTTPSTTATFATKVTTLKENYKTFLRYTLGYEFPQDHSMWVNLGSQGKTLGTPIPGASTHTEVDWLSPYW